MPEAALSPNLGRCPTCGQLVTVPADAAARVACPKCRHQAAAAAFGLVEGPLPVLAVPAHSVGSAPRHTPDDERTHLLLDLPCDDDAGDDDATLLPLAPAATAPVRQRRAPPSAARARSSDDERTHLLLNSADLQEEPDFPAPPGASTDNERTHLLLGPISVRAEQTSLPGRLLELLSRLLPPALRCSVWLEEALHGRWTWALGATAIVCGFLAPGLDFVATRGAATLGLLSWLSSSLALSVLGLALLNELRNDSGQWDPRVLGPRLRSRFWSLAESFEHWARSPRYLQLQLLAELLGCIGIAGLGWAAFLSSLRWVVGLGAAASGLPFLSGALLLAALLLGWRSVQTGPVPALFLQDFGNALAAAAELPPILDLDEPLPAALSSGTTLLHESVRALGKWRARDWPDEAAYRAALERHFQRLLPGARLERERWMGVSRLDGVIDLVISGMLVVGVKRGFDAATAERAIGQMSRYARSWSGKPMLLVVFEAERAAVLEGENARLLLSAHEEFALLTVRMPAP